MSGNAGSRRVRTNETARAAATAAIKTTVAVKSPALGPLKIDGVRKTAAAGCPPFGLFAAQVPGERRRRVAPASPRGICKSASWPSGPLPSGLGLVRAAISEVDAAAQGVADGGLDRAMTIQGG